MSGQRCGGEGGGVVLSGSSVDHPAQSDDAEEDGGTGDDQAPPSPLHW